MMRKSVNNLSSIFVRFFVRSSIKIHVPNKVAREMPKNARAIYACYSVHTYIIGRGIDALKWISPINVSCQTFLADFKNVRCV